MKILLNKIKENGTKISQPKWTPLTKRIIVVTIGLVLITLIISSAVTGDLDLLIEFAKSVVD